MKNFKLLTIVLLILAVIPSCKKVIDVNLNDASPQVVIEGAVTDQPGPYTIKLTQSVNFSNSNIFPAISGAQVNINDNAGNAALLAETSPGNYTTSAFAGTPGRTYTLLVTANGKNYTAVSTMPAAVNIDTLLIDSTSSHGGFGGGFGGGGHSNTKKIDVVFQDPAGIANYYRLVEVINGIEKTSISITSDNLRDGSIITRTLTAADIPFQHGGYSVTVYLQSIDKNVYEYFRTLQQIVNGGGGLQASTPDNPTTNINNNALGYFSTYGVRSKKIVIP